MVPLKIVLNVSRFKPALNLDWVLVDLTRGSNSLNSISGPREASLPNPGQDGDLHEREDLRIACRKHLRTKNNIEPIGEQLRARDLLWMVSLPLDSFEPQAYQEAVVAELNRLKELSVMYCILLNER